MQTANTFSMNMQKVNEDNLTQASSSYYEAVVDATVDGTMPRPIETRAEMTACRDGGHLFLRGGDVCSCGKMERKNFYCAECGAWHKRTVKR